MVKNMPMPLDDLLPSKARPWKTRFAVMALATGMIIMIWIVAINQYLTPALMATAVVLIVAMLGLRTLEEQARCAIEMAESQRRLLTAQTIGQMGEWSYDPSSDMLRCSPSLTRMYGNGDRMEVKMADTRCHLAPEDLKVRDEALRSVLETGESRQYQKTHRRPDGVERIHRVIVYPTRNAEGAITGVHGIDQDITAAKRLESLETRIADLARLDAMHLMAATLAHEINQPLTAAANYLAAGRRVLARAGTAVDPDVDRLIRSGEGQVRDAGDIVRRVRQMVMKQDERVPVMVMDAWDKTLQLVEVVSPEKNIVFASDIGLGADVVIADAVQLGQVFTNLVRNAVEAVDDEVVVIGLTTRLDEAGCVRLSIRDNGSGLAVSDSDFFALHGSTNKAGLGLGLLISRTIVESHGGRIWVDSSGPEGTVVAFTLPVEAA
jgi:PAS domain S-box-containing protein